jgi:DNA polymerase-1
MSEKLFLIDGTAIIYRAFFALIRNPLINSKGQNTSAIYGTINTFLRLVKKYNVKHIAISFDRREKTFRHEITETYKANRPPAPEELHAQVEPIKKFFELINIPEISKAGYEADDVLATIAEKYKDEFDVIIVTGDKDFSQLVDEKVIMYDPFKERVTKIEDVIEKYGLKPEQFVDYLAICGDAADNIPGVRGIGPKGATTLLREYSTLENIYNNLDNISSEGTRTKLEESRENAFLSQELAKIIRNVPIDDPKISQFEYHEEDLKNSIDLLKEYELNSIIKKISVIDAIEPLKKGILEEEQKVKIPKFEYNLVDNKSDFHKLISYLKDHKIIAIDTETTSTDPLKAKLVGISLCAEKNRAFYVSIAHQMADNLDVSFVIERLQKVLLGKLLIAHNIKYDYMVLKNAGWEINQNVFDTMIADYLLNPTSRHSLAACAKREFEYDMVPISNLIGVGKKQITFDLVPPSQAAEYSADDANITFKLYEIFYQKLKDQNLYDLFENIEMPLFKTLAKMETNGVYIDTKILSDISRKNQINLGELTRKIYDISGYQFNLNSTQQLAKVLFEDLKIPPVKKTKTGYSTDVSVLEILSRNYEIAKLLMDYRQINKLESTYVTALPRLINPVTGRVHSSFNQTVASTGRLSSSNPNMQNIPIRTEQGKEIRKAFTVDDDNNVILAADYSQIELRILAMLSKDEKMINAFKNREDIHRETASIIYDVPSEQVTPSQRRYAKIINFGLMYGMGAFRVSNELGISRKEAQEFIYNYFNKFPTIKDYIDFGIGQARKNIYVSTILGRKLHLPDLQSTNKVLVREAERVAVNMPIQGSAADIIKIAMNNIHNKIKDDPDIKMIIQVHDELVFEVKKSKLDLAKELIVKEMENALPEEYSSIVPLVVDIGIGKDWFEAH